jgi:hypothetical protein
MEDALRQILLLQRLNKEGILIFIVDDIKREELLIGLKPGIKGIIM